MIDIEKRKNDNSEELKRSENFKIFVFVLIVFAASFIFLGTKEGKELQKSWGAVFYGKAGIEATKGNYKTAFKLCFLAANMGCTQAKNTLGFYYHNGLGVKYDGNKAFYWFSKAADDNYPAAICNLGVCYNNGNGCDKDIDEAAKCYKRALDAGYKRARITLARIYLLEYDGKYEKEGMEHLQIFLKEDRNNEEACELMAECYEKGIGVEKNQEEAEKWYSKSVDAKLTHN